jgi:hypothetical protein
LNFQTSQALASLQQDVESRLREAQEQVAHLDRRNKELEKVRMTTKSTL